jgi:hypothetical protein
MWAALISFVIILGVTWGASGGLIEPIRWARGASCGCATFALWSTYRIPAGRIHTSPVKRIQLNLGRLCAINRCALFPATFCLRLTRLPSQLTKSDELLRGQDPTDAQFSERLQP